MYYKYTFVYKYIIYVYKYIDILDIFYHINYYKCNIVQLMY